MDAEQELDWIKKVLLSGWNEHYAWKDKTYIPSIPEYFETALANPGFTHEQIIETIEARL